MYNVEFKHEDLDVDVSTLLRWCTHNIGYISSGEWNYYEYVDKLTIRKYIFSFESKVHYTEFILKYK